MDFSLPPELAELERRIHDFVAAEVIPLEADPRQSPHGPSRELCLELQRRGKAAGLWSLHAPTRYGGLGLTHFERAVVFEAAGYSLLGPIALNCMPGEGDHHMLAVIATPEQQQRWLKPLLDGELKSTFAVTEPDNGAGADPTQMKTSARPDGADFLITGRKWLITGFREAAFHLVMAQTENAAGDKLGATLFVVDAHQPLGIVTESDTARLLKRGTSRDTTVQDIMSSPAISAPHGTDFHQAMALMQRFGIRHLIAVDGEGRLAGLATETDFRSHIGLEALKRIRDLTAIMEREPSTFPPGTTLATALTRMLAEGRDYALVAQDEIPRGIVTERDLPGLLARGVDIRTVTLGEIMSPVRTVRRDIAVPVLAEEMSRRNIRHAVVVEFDGRLRGVITQHQLVERLSRNLFAAGWAREHETCKDLESRLGLVLETAGVGVWKFDHTADRFVWSPTLCAMLGYRESQMPASITGWAELIHPADRAHAAARWAAGQQAHDPLYEAEYRLQAADGDWRWLLTRGRVMGRDAGGGPTMTMGVTMDISARKRIKDDLQCALEAFNNLVNDIPVGIYKFRISAAGEIGFDYVSPRWCEALGVRAEDVYRDAQAALDRIHPEDLPGFLAANRAARVTGSAFDWEGRFLKDGAVRWLRTESRPTALPDGELLWNGVQYDVTERRESELRLRLAATVFDNAHEGICITDAQERILEVNATFTEVTGFSREEALGQTPRILGSGHQGADFYAGMWQALSRDDHWRGELWNRRRNGELYAERLAISTVRDAAGQTMYYVGVLSDVTATRRREEQLEKIAHYDALTGIPNRALLADRMRQAIAHTLRHRGLLAVCYLDLDGFKPVNDRYGHAVGDRVLVEMAERLQGCLRGGDTVARLGGDEFVLLLGIGRADETASVQQRLLQAISRPVTLNEQPLVLSASIGITLYPRDNADPETLLRHADQAMYVAKQEGGNRYHVFDPKTDRQAGKQHELVLRIERALREREFELHYQPCVNLRTGAVTGAEALLRWRHPRRGLLAPEQFLPPIAHTGVMLAISDFVLDTALDRLAAWRTAGRELTLNVNIGAHECENPDFIAKLKQRLARPCPRAPRRGSNSNCRKAPPSRLSRGSRASSRPAAISASASPSTTSEPATPRSAS